LAAQRAAATHRRRRRDCRIPAAAVAPGPNPSAGVRPSSARGSSSRAWSQPAAGTAAAVYWAAGR